MRQTHPLNTINKLVYYASLILLVGFIGSSLLWLVAVMRGIF
jgi:hypothetical protein